MPNHFYLQVKQYNKEGIEKLMRRVLTSYVQYFNRKYQRKGPLFESTYKAVSVVTDQQHVYLSSYIHRNPIRLTRSKFDFIQFSSYPYYLGKYMAEWVKTKEILSFFQVTKNLDRPGPLSYQSFVESILENPESFLNGIILEENA